MMSIQYNVVIEKAGKETLIDWGNSPDWIKNNRDLLDSADRLSLIPKPGAVLPVVSVALGPERRWILVSRVFGTLNPRTNDQRELVRLYCIGWQTTVNEKNVKSTTWVYPNGTIEVAEDPSFVPAFVSMQRAAEPV